MKFENFLEDMGERPENTTLDRRNNNEGYTKANCRWATIAEQNTNQRPRKNTVYYDGKTLREWVDILNVKYATLHARLRSKGTVHI